MTDLLSKYQKQQIEWQLKLNSEFPLEYVRREAALQYMKHPHKKGERLTSESSWLAIKRSASYPRILLLDLFFFSCNFNSRWMLSFNSILNETVKVLLRPYTTVKLMLKSF